MPNKIAILSTRPLTEMLLEEAAAADILIDELSFIETEPIQSIDVQQEIEQAFIQSLTVVFTSMNAVEAVAYYQEEERPDWKIYCIGTTTQQLVGKYFGEDAIAGTADDAGALAELIIENEVTEEVMFFCGDRRRDELPSLLQEHDINVTEVIVYQTIVVPHKIDKTYNGILFFSPSAVASFFQKNKLPPTTILFAIGTTTAAEIKKYTTNKIIIGNSPGKSNLVKKMMDYFT